LNGIIVGQDIQELINGCISGDPLAQRQLYDRFSPKMFGVCLQYSNDSEEAKDILQEGFIKVFRNLKQFKGKGSFEGWIRKIFINTALERFRGKVNLIPVEEPIEIPTANLSDKIISELSAHDLLQMIQELSPQYRLVFNLYAIEGYTHVEISKKLKISVGTSKSNLSRARAILQEKVKTRKPSSWMGRTGNAK
jgi:RNA polymerase sigma-70 factor (ECF subfamily)